MSDELYMRRCLEIAQKGAGYVAPNPMVGAVLVHEKRIIGEGFHREYGQAHAEVNCIDSVKEEDKKLIPVSVLYVSLEPCSHFGKTPPCADLIIQNKIPKVVIGCRDPFKEVDGKGIEKLRAAGVEVITGVLEKECRELNKRFFTFHTKRRPYIILKWAQTADGFIAPLPSKERMEGDTGANVFSGIDDAKAYPGGEGRLLISNEYSNRLVHKWRSEEAAILIGSRTALYDDPSLTTRLWPGPSPLRLVVDRNLQLPCSLKIFDGEVKTIVFNTRKQVEDTGWFCAPSPKGKFGVGLCRVSADASLVQQIVNALHAAAIQSVLVEGGARLLQSFIDEGMWDEIRTVSNEQLAIKEGLPAPLFTGAVKTEEINLLSDRIKIYKPEKTSVG